MATVTPVCTLDETWEDCLQSFRKSLEGCGNWSSFCIDGVDKEAILSAPEVMDKKTDAGFQSGQVYSLDYLLSNGDVKDCSLLSDNQLVDLMDIILAKELHYLRGYALSQSYLCFPYFLKMPLLYSQHPTLYAYCRAVLRTLEYVLCAVCSTSIHSDEEFMMAPAELDRLQDCSSEEVLAGLEEAACKTESPTVASRLRWRKQWLSSLMLFLEAKKRADVEAAAAMSVEAADMLKTDPAFQRSGEPLEDAAYLRPREVSYWVNDITPTDPLPTPPFATVVEAYDTMLRQLASLADLHGLATLQGITDFVEGFGAQQPLLPIRCIAVVVLFNQDPNVSFLYGPSLPQRILTSLEKDFGAPLYKRIVEGDNEMLDGVVKYRIHRTLDPLKITPDQFVFLSQQTVEYVRRWASEVSKRYLVHLEAMLCNRGLAHRRLMKVVREYGALQELSYSTDVSVFLALQPGVAANSDLESTQKSTVLTLYVNQLVLRQMELVLLFTLELDLFTQGELLAALWYLNFTQRAQLENQSILCLSSTGTIPAQRINKKTGLPLYNLALTTRTIGRRDSVRHGLLEARRMFSDALFLAGSVMEHAKLLDLTNGPATSMTSIADAFNHRLGRCFGHIRHPSFTPYDRCIAAKPDFTAEGLTLTLCAKKGGEVALAAANKLHELRLQHPVDGSEESRQVAGLRVQMEQLERSCRALAASLASFEAVGEDSEAMKGYHVTVDRRCSPSFLIFAFHKKP